MKRIILLCDGTWQNSLTQDHRNPSNVSRLARAIKPVAGNGIQQIVYYHPGVGSYGGPLAWFLGGSFGEGIVKQMEDVYSFLSYNYLPGDEIFFFGFSRGSYMVRALCSFVLDFGILRKPGMSEFVPVFKMFMKKDFAKNAALQELQSTLAANGVLILPEENGEKIKVKVIGCFDTVGSLGIPRVFPWQADVYAFLDMKLNSNVQYAFHALALDELRSVFQPTLWFFDPKGTNFQNYKQVWFTGAHLNVGGGPMSGLVPFSNLLPPPWNSQAPNVLCDGTLIWMIGQCWQMLDFDEKYLHVDVRAAHTRRDGELIYGGRASLLAEREEPVWYRGPIENVFAGIGMFFLLLGIWPRTVCGYMPWEKDFDWFFVRWLRWLEYVFFRSKNPSDLVTKETVHMSVYNRNQITGSQSWALRNVILDPPVAQADSDIDISREKMNRRHQEVVAVGPQKKKHVPIETYSAFEVSFWRDEKQNIYDRA
ncbi:hypothetical protein POJ06DRAFT_64803 [Lipomyces tetrasporus]|uniref:T6SS Phospholipase effector Tle1-like catalytic domain-containing protein n=1 Tax=Lipomyces tetrasporus TaxID=54092 RepID=A0AAD7QY70_9ASCO|nr:uncharacterized protein POJ06DRAFT_64803 [Lipomyces tetrasporus]KAJ8103176.1 hypothetical protein POJ06DRAFT_64803 [Lipomyces tetrasporus]